MTYLGHQYDFNIFQLLMAELTDSNLTFVFRSSLATLELVRTRRLRLQWLKTNLWKRQEHLCPRALMSLENLSSTSSVYL